MFSCKPHFPAILVLDLNFDNLRSTKTLNCLQLANVHQAFREHINVNYKSAVNYQMESFILFIFKIILYLFGSERPLFTIPIKLVEGERERD